MQFFNKMLQVKVVFVLLLILCNVFAKESNDEQEIDSQTRYAPEQDTTVPYVLTEARLKDIRSQFMYWYFDLGGSADVGDYQPGIHSSASQLHKNLNFYLPFFGFRFNYMRISINGYLEFSDPPEHLSYPLIFPVEDWPKSNDPSFIGIFFSKCRSGKLRPEDLDQRKPGVYFRLERDLQTRRDKLGVEVRERVKWDIREGIIGAETFEPKHVIISTWKNISFAGGIQHSLTTTNTFQVVIATDEVFTYAIFNYLDLQWTSHAEAGGDTLKGEGGIPAYVGFNAGNGTRSFEYSPYSQSLNIRELTFNGQGNGFNGRHIFRIDENIIPGSSYNDIDEAHPPIFISPESGNMLGGTIVNITGPFSAPGEAITCRFDIETVQGTIINSNKAVCVQPKLSVEGYVRFEILFGPGKSWKGQYFVETPATATQKIYFEDKAVYEKNPSEIAISWFRFNLTTNENVNVRISLWGYRESTIGPEFLYVDEIASGLTNNGFHKITPSSFSHKNNANLTDISFGFIQISLDQPISIEGVDTKITPVIWSRPIPLGWYFAPQWELKFGNRWSERLCFDWIKSDMTLSPFTNNLQKCPCTLEHALADKGRYLPDLDCDKDSSPECQFNRGAVHCVRSGPPLLGGSEQQCCYDRNHFLMLSHDQQWGSNPSRSHNLGSLPWSQATQVPSLSHWYHDVAPRLFCCLWQHENSLGCEAYRTERRPTQDCVSYEAPEVAGVFGDPHIITFDDVTYTFNGKGEFVLVRTNTKENRLDVQGRFEQVPKNAYGEVRATQLTSVAARGNTSTTIEVRLRPPNAQWRYRLDVFANGKRIYFDRPSMKFQHFSDIIVYTPTYILNQSEVIIMFDSGAGVEVIESHGYMTARVFLPSSFINQTGGLLGKFNLNKLDDFVTPDGQNIQVDLESKDATRLIHEEFGMKWLLEDRKDRINKGRALFLREYDRTYTYYSNVTFNAELRMLPSDILPPNRTYEISKAYDFCNDDIQCLYDHTMTGNRNVASFTLNSKHSIISLKETCRRKIISCGPLKTPRFGRKSAFYFIPGTNIYFECDEGFVLVGDRRRECTSEGLWNTPESGVTDCLPI